MVDIGEACGSGLDHIDEGVTEGGGAVKGPTAKNHGLVALAMTTLFMRKGLGPCGAMKGAKACSFNGCQPVSLLAD